MPKAIIKTGSQLPLPTLCRTIKVLVEKGDHAADKAEQFYIAAGKHLIELKSRCAAGTFEKTVRAKIGISSSTVHRYVSIAKGTKTLADFRAEARKDQRLRTKRARLFKQRRRPSYRGNVVSLATARRRYKKAQKGHPPGDGPKEFCIQGYLNRAETALEMAEYKDDFSKKVSQLNTDELLPLAKAARQAAIAWNKLAAELERKANVESETQSAS